MKCIRQSFFLDPLCCTLGVRMRILLGFSSSRNGWGIHSLHGACGKISVCHTLHYVCGRVRVYVIHYITWYTGCFLFFWYPDSFSCHFYTNKDIDMWSFVMCSGHRVIFFFLYFFFHYYIIIFLDGTKDTKRGQKKNHGVIQY